MTVNSSGANSVSCATRVSSGTSIADKNGDGLDSTPGGAVTAVITATRTSGPAPLGVQFRSFTSTHDTQSLDVFRELGYHFTFDDPAGGATWAHSSKSKNSQIGGPISAHVFESPGTYDAKVRVQDSYGNFDDATVQITVTDPDTVYATTDTIVISTNSDTTGAPDGATLLTNQVAWPTWESSKRYYLMSGQNYSSFGAITLLADSDIQIDKLGAGNDPVVGNIDISRGVPVTSNWSSRIALIDLAAGQINIPNAAEDIYIIRGTHTSLYTGDTIEYRYASESQAVKDTLRWPDNIVVYEAVNTSPDRGFNCFIHAKQFSFIGCELGDPSQHNLRLPYIVDGFVAHNKFYGAGSAHHNIKWHGNGGDAGVADEILAGDCLSAASERGVIADNLFGDGTAQVNLWSVAIDPQNNVTNEVIIDVILENNTYDGHNFTAEYVLGGKNLTSRNNVLININPADTVNFTTDQNVSQVPVEFHGPYYTETSQVIPGAPA